MGGPAGGGARPPFEERVRPGPPPAPAARSPRPHARPRVALLIDDLGYDLELDRAFYEIDADLSFSFLPGAPYTEVLAGEAARRGRDVLVHVPMEPMDPGVDPGPGALRVDLPPGELRARLRWCLSEVPGAVGANNHMGSRFTRDAAAMSVVLAELRHRGLFFVDSRTASGSTGLATAAALGVPAAARTVFLDDDPSPRAIRRQLRRVVAAARRRGEVVAIGHPYPATWEVLSEELPRLRSQVELVPVHVLVK
nr:divergent polysaccharide deacetylase family protein [Dissulfurirhabdus thermomarina]